MGKKPLHFSRTQAFIFGIKGTIDNFGVWLGAILASLIIGAISLVPAGYFLFRDAPHAEIKFNFESIIPYIWNQLWQANLPAFMISALVAALIISWLFLGLIRIALDIYNEREAEFDRLFAEPLLAINFLIATILFCVIVGIGSLFLAVPGIFAFLMLSFYGVIIAEYKSGPLKAFGYSYDITRNNLVEVFIFYMLLSSFGTITGGYLSLGLPIALLVIVYLFKKLDEDYKANR